MQPIRLCGPSQRAYAKTLIDNADKDSIVSLRKPSRSAAQNAKMWALLRDVSNAAPEGRNWVPEVWKAAFMQSLGHQCLFAEGLDGSGPFPVGFRTSRLTAKQMADLIEVIYEYGSRHDVPWRETMRGGHL